MASKGIAYVSNLAVSSDARRQGVGRALLQSAERVRAWASVLHHGTAHTCAGRAWEVGKELRDGIVGAGGCWGLCECWYMRACVQAHVSTSCVSTWIRAPVWMIESAWVCVLL